VGPFVVYMKYVGQDLSTIFTMFVTLFIPAACVFYKTVYMHLGCKASLDEEGFCPDEAQRKWYETIFVVLRMVLIDYNYDEGAKATQTSFPIWWMVASISWIVVSSVVVLNLLIALMADSYSRIFESAELFARIERARFIIEFEREMTQEQLEGYEQTIRVQYAPEIVTFDPVCDRDKIDIIEEHVETLGTKVDRLEALIEKRILVDLQKKLEAIDQALTLYNY